MDPIIATAVSALSAGALAVAKGFADEGIKDAYKTLRGFIVARFAKTEPTIEDVEQDPESPAEQQVLAKKMAAGAGDPELKELSARLLIALETLQAKPEAKAVIDLLRSKIGTIDVEDATSTGSLVAATDSEATSIRLKNVHQGGDKKKP